MRQGFNKETISLKVEKKFCVKIPPKTRVKQIKNHIRHILP